jgi:Protein of unknown function (DUF3617)
MSTLRLLSLALGASLCCVAAASADPVMPNVNLGLWDIKASSQVNGDLQAMAAARMKGLSAQQKVIAQGMMANIAKTITAPAEYQECLTADDLKNGFKPDPQADKDACTETLTSSSATALDATIVCNGQDKVNGTMHFDTPTPIAMTGTIDMTIVESGVPVRITRTLEGTWLQADCGNVKP